MTSIAPSAKALTTQVREKFDCSKCGAKAGVDCRAPSGRRADQVHAERFRLLTPDMVKAASLPGEPIDDLEKAIGKRATVTPDVRKNSICFIIRTSRMTVRRTVSKGDVKVESTVAGKDPDQEMVTVAKDLLDSPELRKIATFDHVTKLRVKAQSVPSPLLRSSAYLIAVDGLVDMYGYMEKRKRDRAPLEAAFEAAYPVLVAEAKKRLGSLFDPSEYPPVKVIRQLFSFEWQVVEVGTPDAKLRSVSQALFEKEKAKAEQVWVNAVGQINEALAEGMADVVAHLSERLGGGDEPPKRFRASAIKRVTDFLDAFGNRNITENADLAKLVSDARRLLSGVDAKVIKGETDTRKQVIAGFAVIKRDLDAMLEARPARAISLDGEV